jgi:hypothetical protein
VANDGSILTVVKHLAVALLLPLVLSGQSITGKIVDPIPLPWPNLPVGLLPVGADWVTTSTHTNASGAFRFFPVEPGNYVVILRANAFRGQVIVVRVSGGETNVGTLEPKFFTGCESPIGNCNTLGTPTWPEAPVADLCETLKRPDRYAGKVIVMVGMLTTLHGWPTLSATCDNSLSSDGLTWTNAVLLPEGAVPQRSPTFPKLPDLEKKLADLAAAIRKTSGLPTSRVAAVYGFLDIPDGFQVVPCSSDSCTRPDIRMPPASFLRVDGFQELK